MESISLVTRLEVYAAKNPLKNKNIGHICDVIIHTRKIYARISILNYVWYSKICQVYIK